jgi:hypothetical protein
MTIGEPYGTSWREKQLDWFWLGLQLLVALAWYGWEGLVLVAMSRVYFSEWGIYVRDKGNIP